MRRLALIPCLVAVAGTAPGCGSVAGGRDAAIATGSGDSISARVTKVVDGDTIHARPLGGGRDLKVRLLGIDAPESSSTRYGRPSCGGAEATAALRAVAPKGAVVTLEPDPTQDTVDRYGRVLAYEVLPGGVTAEERLLSAGWAKVYIYRKPFRLLDAFRRAAGQAVRAHRGIYARCGGRLQRPL
jgi:micrococcal nuclease